MLTTTREAEIRAEETLRLLVRDELDRTRTKKPLWTLANSPFFLWFLSSIVLASISFLYAKHEEQQRKDLETHATLRKLDAEMAIRLDHLLGLVEDPKVTSSTLRQEIVQTWTGQRGTLYAEYKSMGLFSLAALAQIHASGKEAAEIRSARLAFDRLWTALKKDVDWKDPSELDAFASGAKSLIRLAALGRWRLDAQDAKPH